MICGLIILLSAACPGEPPVSAARDYAATPAVAPPVSASAPFAFSRPKIVVAPIPDIPDIPAPRKPAPAPPIPTATRPALWKLTDAFGQTWTHQDKLYLEAWVARRNRGQ